VNVNDERGLAGGNEVGEQPALASIRSALSKPSVPAASGPPPFLLSAGCRIQKIMDEFLKIEQKGKGGKSR